MSARGLAHGLRRHWKGKIVKRVKRNPEDGSGKAGNRSIPAIGRNSLTVLLKVDMC